MALDQVYADLENEGYSVQAFIIPACAVDAPHRRDRTAILAYTNFPRQQGCEQHGTPCDREPRCAVSECGEAVSYAVNRRRDVRRNRELSAIEEIGTFRGNFREGTQEHGTGEWWTTEPNVGRSLDGVSCWLDGIGGLSNEAKERAREILRNLREETVSETVQWTIGRFNSISKAEVLLAFLCEYEEECNGSRISLESRTISERKLRDLWRTIEFARTSHRREYHSQLAREYSDTLFRLSHGAPSLMSEAWEDNTWENGIERVATGVPSRVDRLKCLGNAVVPQQFYPIFQAIADIERGIVHG